jgi:hypothetical protein
VRSLLLVVVALAAGCASCKSDAGPTNPTGGSTGGGGGAGAPVPRARPGAPFDVAAYEQISKLDFAGAPTEVLELSDSGLAIRVTPAGDPPVVATLRLSKCLNCVGMDRAAWEARMTELKQLLPKEVRELPDTVFEVGDTTVNGGKVIYVYQLAVFAVGGTGGKPLEKAINTHAYALHWNDGINQVQITVKDGSPPDQATVDGLAARAPRDRLGKLASDLFTTIEPYVHGQ